MSNIKSGGLDQYGAGPFKFGTAGVEGVKHQDWSVQWNLHYTNVAWCRYGPRNTSHIIKTFLESKAEVLNIAGNGWKFMEMVSKWQPKLFGHTMRNNGLEETGYYWWDRRQKSMRATKWTVWLHICWLKNISPLELIKVTENWRLWRSMIANIVVDDTTTWKREETYQATLAQKTYHTSTERWCQAWAWGAKCP